MSAVSLVPLAPDAHMQAMRLVPDDPHMVMARAMLLQRHGAIVADDRDHPAALAIAGTTADGRTLFLFGDPEHPALATFVHTLSGPVTLRATTAIGACLPIWRPDAKARAFATFTHATSIDEAVFAALPPGGVRRLRPNDVRRLADVPAWLWGIWERPETMLRAVPAYARYLRGELVSIACAVAETERYAQIAAYTIERTRRNGFAQECAQRLIGAILSERGTLPTLTASADNEAAVALAASLGLTTRADHMGYVIP